MQKTNAALVLSGGGAYGLAHVGALNKLEEKYDFSLYSGVSAGAIVAAAHAVGYKAKEISEIIHNQNFFTLAFDFSNSNFGIIRGKKVKQILEDIFQEKTFEELKKKGITLNIQATNFNTGEIFHCNHGKISDAVMASLCVPVLFEPQYLQNTWLVDGGISENFPVQFALTNFSGEKIIAIDVATSFPTNIDFSEKKLFGKLPGIQKILERTFKIMFKNQEKFNTADPRLEIIRPDLSKFRAIDILQLQEIEKVGEEYIQ